MASLSDRSDSRELGPMRTRAEWLKLCSIKKFCNANHETRKFSAAECLSLELSKFD